MKKLRDIHPDTLTQEENDDGPVCWILLIPTTEKIMRDFLSHTLNEQQLLENTSPGLQYDAVYLCSALVLPEYRGKGIAKRLTFDAIQAIRKNHPIHYLYYWSFSAEGDGLAASVANETGMTLLKKVD
jgi:GNAT superfamily N-acetyltransferase